MAAFSRPGSRIVAQRSREDPLDPDHRLSCPADRPGRPGRRDLTYEEGPSEVECENVQRRAVVGANLRGRDIAGFVPVIGSVVYTKSSSVFRSNSILSADY
jgi:hypothetical protein